MKKTVLFLLPCILSWGFFSCQNTTTQAPKNNTSYLALGDSISAVAQAILSGHLQEKMKKEGSAGAVLFCSQHAQEITDSLAGLYGVELKRITEKNRNPNNAFSEKEDHRMWTKMQQWHKENGTAAQAELVESEKRVLYYKPILLAMPTCLACHGPEEQIDSLTRKHIAHYYPEDKAMNYALGDMRALWKIEFSKED